ncbi:MAG: hypothetical protein H7308_12565 [Chthonomonadaceae bacterium]|nr:hypothetical protein [Chthonomonadaceae bacterium]
MNLLICFFAGILAGIAIVREMKSNLAHYGYPKSSLTEIYVGIKSQENIENGGGDWFYFK